MDNEILRRKSNRRAWLIVVTSFMCMFTIYAITLNCIGLFMKPMAASFETTRAVIGSISSVSLLVAIPSMLVFAVIFDKKNVKIPMAVGCLLTGIGFIVFSSASSLMMCYAAAILIGLGASGTMQLPITLVLNNWFVEKRGLALGIAFSGSGVGGVVFTQLINFMIETYSWRTAYMVLGIIILYFLGAAAIAFVMSAVKGHIPAYMTDIGYTEQMAANILSLTVFTVIPAKPIFGVVFDKFGDKVGVAASVGMMAIAAVLIIFTPWAFIFAILFGAIYGFGSAYSTIGPAILIGDLFKGNKNFATIFSIASIGASLASAFGSPVYGAIYDNTGSYTGAWILSAVMLTLGMLLVIAAVKVVLKKQKTEQEAGGIK